MNNIIITNYKRDLLFTYNNISKSYSKPVNVYTAYFDFYEYANITSYKSIIFDFITYQREYNSCNELLNFNKYYL